VSGAARRKGIPRRPPRRGSLPAAELLAEAADLAEGRSGRNGRSRPRAPFFVGVDLGTANVVLAVADRAGRPWQMRWRPGRVVRDGLVVDFVGAVDMLREMKSEAESALGFELPEAASGFPPGVPRVEIQAVGYVLQSAGFDCVRLIDEPSAANLVLGIRDGAIVDVGGGTTGVAVIRDGAVVRTADEATGGTHFTLVIAGGLGISFDEAEDLKLSPQEQPRLFSMVRPVMEKVGAIIARHLGEESVPAVHLVGGASAYHRMDQVLADYLRLPVFRAAHPMWVTPLGLAMAHAQVRRPADGRH
jgi:ethanolamine utilization protein EutJ